MHAAMAEMIVMVVVIAGFVMVVIVRMCRAMYFVAAVVGVGRQGSDGLRGTFQAGKHDSGQDGKDDGSVHGYR